MTLERDVVSDHDRRVAPARDPQPAPVSPVSREVSEHRVVTSLFARVSGPAIREPATREPATREPATREVAPDIVGRLAGVAERHGGFVARPVTRGWGD